MKNTPRPEARELLRQVPAELRLRHTTLLAFRELVAEMTARAVFITTTFNGGDSLENVSNRKGEVFRFIESPDFRHLAAAKAVLFGLESDADVKAAAEVVEPLLIEVAELDRLTAERQHAISSAHHTLKAVEETARAEAIKSADSAPEVVAARAAVLKIESAPLFKK
jgi:hypothetical protein